MLTRRAFGALALTTAAAGLVGCGRSNTSAGDEKVTVSFWTHTHPPMIKVYRDLISTYQAEHPNVTIDYQTIPNDQFSTKMLTSLSNGSGPDVINMDDSALRGDYIPKELLAPIDPKALGADSVDGVTTRYIDGALAGATGPDGAVYGLPSEFNGTAFAVNVKHLADAGLDPDKVTLATWDDVRSVGEKLIAAGHTQAFSFSYLHAGWYSQWMQTLLGQTGGRIADGTTGTLDSPTSVEALQLWSDLAVGPGRLADPNVTSKEATTPYADLGTGKQSMAIVFPWAMDQLKETNPATYANLRVVALPQLHPDTAAHRVYGYYWAVNKTSKQQGAAWAFVDFLSRHPDDFLTGTNFVQPVRDWQDSAAAKKIPFLDVWSQAYANGRFDEVTPHYAEVQDAITTMVNDVVFDKTAVDQAAADASSAITRILSS